MKLAILGAGNVGGALGKGWAGTATALPTACRPPVTRNMSRPPAMPVAPG